MVLTWFLLLLHCESHDSSVNSRAAKTLGLIFFFFILKLKTEQIKTEKKITFFFVYLGILAIGLINEALDEGDAGKTLQALQIPAAKLEGVLAEVAQHYQDTLIRAKREKAQVSSTALL